MDAITRFTPKFTFFLSAALLIAAPVTVEAQSLAVSSTSVALCSQAANITISSSTGAQIAFSVAASFPSGPTSVQNWFTATVNQNTTSGTSLATLTLFNRTSSGNSQSGTVTLTDTANASDTVTISVSYTPGCGGTTGNANLSSSASSVAMGPVAAFGGVAQSQVTISSNSAATIIGTVTTSTTNGIAWLSVNSNSISVSSTLSAVLTFTASAASLSNGSYSGSVTITPSNGGSSISIGITFTVGTGSGTLSANPSNVNLSYPNGSQCVYINSSSGTASSYTVQAPSSTNNWLLVNGGLGQITQSINSCFTVSLNSTANTVNSGTQATLNVVGNDNSSTSVFVTVINNTSSSGVTISPSSVTFSVAGGTFGQQNTNVNLTTVYSSVNVAVNYTTNTGGSWLSASLPGGATLTANSSNLLTIYATPNGLASGTYTGTVYLQYSSGYSGSAQIPVTLNVGTTSTGGTGGLVAPTSLTFAYQTTAPGFVDTSSNILVNASGTWTTSVSYNSTNQTWLNVSQSGNSGQPVSVSAVPQQLAVGTYSATITISTLSGTAQVPVSLNVNSGMVSTTQPGAILNTGYNAGDPNPTPTTVYVYASDNSAQPVTATPSVSWITVNTGNNTNPTTPAIFGIQIIATGLPNGLNTGSISFSVNGASNSPWILPVAIIVNGSTATAGPLSFSPTSLTFNLPVGGSSSSQALLVTSSLVSTYTVTATSSGWLSVASGTQSVGQNLAVIANPVGLAAGTYSGTLNFTASNGVNQTVSVSLVVGGTSNNGLTASPSSLSFSYQLGASAPSSQTINVQSTSGSVGFQASATTSSGGSWLTVSPAGAQTTPLNLTAGINTSVLTAPGTYTGTISLSTSSGTPLNVGVTLTVTGSTAVTATPTSLSFTYQAGSAAPAAQSVTVSGTGTFSATASSSGNWLSVSPTSGSSPTSLSVSVNPGSLTAGTYNGTIVVAGTGSSSGSTTINVSLVVIAPLPTITQIGNSGSYASGSISPGELITIFGTALGPATPVQLQLDSTGTHVITSLGGVQVLVNGVASPLIYVSSTQVSAIVPYAMAIYQSATVLVKYLGQTSNGVSETVATTAPGIFTANASGTGPGAIGNQDFSPNSPTNPAARGSVITLYLTGEGQTSPGGVDGLVTVAKSTSPVTPAPLLPVAVLINNSPVTPLFAGEAPGIVSGVLQVNVQIPQNFATGNLPIMVMIGANSTQNGVTVSVK